MYHLIYYIVFILQGVVYDHVIKLTGVRISVPSTKLLAETEICKTLQNYKCIYCHIPTKEDIYPHLFFISYYLKVFEYSRGFFGKEFELFSNNSFNY